MNAGGIVLLGASAVLALFVAWRIRTGRSYTFNYAQKVQRATDPFSFWLSVIIPGAVALFLAICGIALERIP